MGEGMDGVAFLKAVLDPQRLAVLGLIAARPRRVAELAAALDTDERAVVEALATFVRGGVVEASAHGRYRLVPEALIGLARDLPQPPPVAREVGFGMTADEQAVLARFFRGYRLVEVPAQQAKRRVILERLALEFEPGARYAEAEVNAILARFHDDVASLRRHLVDEGYLDRAAGRYWRSGGRVDP